ncbi:MAG TPA: prolyl oligopeptidase family serine peptidase [bacterium]
MQKLSRWFAMILLFLVLVSASVFGQTALKDEMRLPWAQTQGGFLREWLIVGGFPNPNGAGYDTDLLLEHEGEQGIRPIAGMTHKLPDGTALAWKSYHSPYNYVNFLNVLQAIDFYNKIAYAYTTVEWPRQEKTILSFGSNVGNKIWVNGKLVYESKNNWTAKESHHVEVEMEKGGNSILMKSIHGGWTWGFTLRLIKPESFSLIHDFHLSPSIVKSDRTDDLKLQTDRSENPEIKNIDVQIKAVAAGGKIVAEKTAKRGEEASFQTTKWPDGVYEIRFESENNRSELVTAYLYWHKGDGLMEARELVSTAPKNPQTPAELTHAMLADLVIDRLGHNPAAIDSIDVSAIYSPLVEYAELKLQAAGKPGPARANGFVRLAYRDETDGTPQFCRAYLPLKYDANKKWPLVLKLHGYNPPNPQYIHWWAVDNRHYDFVDRYPVIYLEPHGRGNTGYQGIGELDVLRCVEMAKQYFNVDEDRIYLFGDSMGGGGTWYVGSRHPELFAAIAPIYGGWDYHVSMQEEELAQLTESRRFELESNSSFAQAEALLTTPVFVLHGDVDKAVDVKHSQYAVQMLQRWGYDIRYREFPYFGHEGLDMMDDLLPWLLRHKRNAHPQTVRVRSAHLESASAHWLKVTQRDDPYAFIEAEAEALVNNTVRLFSENALEVELSPSAPLIDPQKPITIIWNIDDLRETRMVNGKIQLRAKDYQPAALTKTAHIAGPIADVTTTPFALVIGTISDDSVMVKLCQQKAQEFIDDWKGWQKYEPRVFKDTELTEIDMQKYSLILYGGANANLVARKLSDKIPLQISDDAISVAGQRFEATDACVQMIYPHPLNQDRYVTIIGATSGAGLYFYTARNRELDFFIQDGCMANERQGRPMGKLQIARGIFDYNWQISDKTLTTGDPELRKNAAVRKVLPDLTIRIDNLPEIDPQIFDTLAGTYEIQPGANVSVFREGDRLLGKGPDGKSVQLYPASATEYFLSEDDIQLTFEKNASGVVERIVIHEGGRETPAKKINTGTN